MSIPLRDLLLQAVLDQATFTEAPGASEPTLSQKNWVNTYNPVNNPFITVNPSEDEINHLFGPEDDFDRFLLSQHVYPLNNNGNETLQSEGDSVRVFYTRISLPVVLALQPLVIQRSETGPLGPTSYPQTVDWTYGYLNSCLVIGELKRHGIIRPSRWIGPQQQPGSTRVWLGKELRG